ncbi:Uncharacterized protein M6B38_210715 [Iris pallida]|uniref:Uncharacterized protein n=1 Tax=Iris pallida TaxID=29817 RepID=A0AAX6E3W2_IRIPA|nr:Uncharacterized protein M6B38_210715 [Iris pallida]
MLPPQYALIHSHTRFFQNPNFLEKKEKKKVRYSSSHGDSHAEVPKEEDDATKVSPPLSFPLRNKIKIQFLYESDGKPTFLRVSGGKFVP